MSERAVIPSRNTFLLFTFFLFGFVLPQSAAAEARPSETYGRLPLHFEANLGQTNEDVRFLARGPGYSVYLTAGEAVVVLAKPNADAKRDAHATRERLGTQTRATPIVVRMSLVGAATKPLVSGLDELPGKANYFIGKDPAKWRANVPTYAKVRYQEVYPGIDLVYYGNQRRLEYDFLVAPGADPNGIVIGFQGAERLEIDAQGELVLHVAGDVIRQRVPVIYQETDGVRTKIEGRYVLKDKHRVGFQVAAYDLARPLVIDPVLVYSTYLGGSGSEQALGIAVDAAGAAYVTGFTTSADFTLGCTAPCTVLDATLGGFADAFVAKLNATGTALVYSTYLGGSGDEFGLGIAVDAAGAAYVTGVTQSTDFTAGCTAPCTVMDDSLGGSADAFVVKIADIMSAPAPTPGKVSLGGFIDSAGNLVSESILLLRNGPVPGGKATFGGNVQFQSADPSPTGNVRYRDHVTSDDIKATSFSTLVIGTGPCGPDTHALIIGKATVNGAPDQDLQINVDDCSEPGSQQPGTSASGPDMLTIMTGPTQVYMNGGPLVGGNIQVKKAQ